jgi:hypothetical protein
MTNELFSELKTWSEKKDSFLMSDFSKKVGIPCKTIRTLSQENEDWKYVLELAHGILVCHAYQAMQSNTIDFEKFLRCIYENDNEFRDQLRKKCEIIPGDEDEFDAWIEKKIAEDKIKYGSD